MMKSGQTSKPSSNFPSRKSYIDFTRTGKGTPGPFIQTRLNMLGDKGTSTSTPSKQSLPSTSSKKQVRFFDSSNSTSSTSSNPSKPHSNFSSKKSYIIFTGTGKGTPGPFIQTRLNMLGDNNNSSSTSSKSSPSKKNVSNLIKFFESSKPTSSKLTSKKSVATQTTTTLNKSTQTLPEKSDKATQTESPTSKIKVSKLRKLFGN